jgi:hypothetical protein
MTHVEDDNSNLGLQTTAKEGQELYSELKGKKYARFPVKTHLILIDEDLDKVIEKYAVPEFKEGDIFCITSKVISITKGFYVKESELKVSWLAKFLVRFVTKHEHDPGFALPQKIQVAMNEVGIPRFIFAMIGGVIMKVIFRKPGYFYILAGHNINAIDGFVPHMYPVPLRGYGFLAPKNPDGICNEIEQKFSMNTAMLDGNNVENIVLGMSEGLKARFSKEELLQILNGNPQGQSGNTPILLVREVE